MVQPRPLFAWLGLSLLTCLLALYLSAPWSLDGVCRSHKSVDLIPSKQIEVPKNIAITHALPCVGTNPHCRSGAATGIPFPPRGEVRALSAPESGQSCPVVACAYNDDPGVERGAESQPSYPRTEATFLPSTENRQPGPPEGQSGDKRAEKLQQPQGADGQMDPSLQQPEMIRRLPATVANIPTPLRDGSQAGMQPNPNQPQLPIRISESDRERAERRADDSWREPETLLESLNGLATAAAGGPASTWAAEVIRQVRALGPAVAGGLDESTGILERLANLNREASQLAEKISDKSLARRLKKTNFALGRRIAVWQEVVRLGVPQLIDTTTAVANPERLAICLAKVDWLTHDSAEGEAWREYLLVDALKESSRRQPSAQDHTTQQLAQRVLERLTQTPLTAYQQKFVSSGPVAVLREELRRWAAEPIGATAVLRDIETYERTGLPSDARRLALDLQHLAVSPIEGRRRLAEQVDRHYRNASCRIAITEELLNKLIPARNLEYAPVDERVLGRPVQGESTMATEIAVRMLPNPNRVRLALEVTGTISSLTTTAAGPARFHNDSRAYYVARKPLEIDMNGISTWPVEVDVQNETQLTGVETPLDGIPLLNAVARGVAKSQMVQNFVGRFAGSEAEGGREGQPAHRPGNPPKPDQGGSLYERAGVRSAELLVARSPVAGSQNLADAVHDAAAVGGRRPVGQPHAPPRGARRQPGERADSRVGAEQLHPAVATQRPHVHLARAVETRCRPAEPPGGLGHQPRPRRRENHLCREGRGGRAVPGQAREPDAVGCGTVQALAEAVEELSDSGLLSAGGRGASAQLVRDGVIQLKPQRVSITTRIALDGIFSRALSSKNTWELVPEQIIKEPKLAYTAITQFEIEDGWIGISLGQKSQAVQTAHRPRWGLW